MHRNNIVYKGYLLSAKVARPAAHKNSAPVFAATVVISLATAAKAGISYDVPQFTRGGFSPSPSKAVDALFSLAGRLPMAWRAANFSPRRRVGIFKADSPFQEKCRDSR